MLIVTDASLLATDLMVGLAAVTGRVRRRTSRAAYQMPWWPAVPLLLIAGMCVVTHENWVADWVPVVVTAAIFAAGVRYYYPYLHPRRGDRWTLPEPADEELP